MAILKLCNTFQVQADPDKICNAWREISKNYYDKYLLKDLTFEEQRILRIRDFFLKFNATSPNDNNPLITKSLSDNEVQKIFNLYLQHYESSWCIFNDVLPLLESLNNEKLGIITNGQTNQQLKKLESAGIKKYFSVIITSHDAGASKPDRKLFDYAAQIANIPIEECHYIGDDLENDAIAANKSGMHGYWINRKNVILIKPNEDISILTSLTEAIDIFQKSTIQLKPY